MFENSYLPWHIQMQEGTSGYWTHAENAIIPLYLTTWLWQMYQYRLQIQQHIKWMACVHIQGKQYRTPQKHQVQALPQLQWISGDSLLSSPPSFDNLLCSAATLAVTLWYCRLKMSLPTRTVYVGLPPSKHDSALLHPSSLADCTV